MKRFFSVVWRMMKSNLLLKIMSIFFAIILWSYVLAEVDPVRVREVEDISVRYTNSAELEAKNLAISVSLSEVLGSIDVKVELKQSELKYLNNKNVFAEVDLSTINGIGEYTLDITSTSTYGEVLSQSQSQITLTVDKLVTNTVPVTIDTIGEVADGYYAMAPVVSQEVINITGARVDVDKVVRSEYTIDLSGLTEGYNESVDLELLDIDGNTVDQNLFTGNIPSVIIKLDVLAKKKVPVDTTNMLLGQDELAKGYELSEITIDPQTVDIIGEKSVLDGISSISVMPISVSGKDSDFVTLQDYDLPEGVSLISQGQAQVYINIKEVVDVKEFQNVPIELKNLKKTLSASLDIESIDVSVIAGVNQLELLFKQDVMPYVDLDGLGVGTHTLDISFDLPEGFDNESVSSTVKQVKVTITN